jgi:hypothetical protein
LKSSMGKRVNYVEKKLPILWNKYSVLGWFFFIGFIRKLK